MSDIIHLLSDHIANQIAAGEVIQRPASAVKELLENAIDAGATEIQLIIKDAGKSLIQVIDNGKGMSPTDARMSFERHATSKIQKIEDLFAIRTMGFRGEALASMAAVAQMEMKTKRKEDELGTHIIIEGTQVVKQEACACNVGTSIMLKNLFFNIPARRNFLKSNTTELRNIVEEFTRVALAHPEITFKYYSNDSEQYHLLQGSLKARIVALFGNNYDAKLVPVSEHTDFLNIQGFVGKASAASKTRGMQYFFLNKRFIKSPFLNHALVQAYDSIIPKDLFPCYFLFLEIDPSKVDVNVHPSKQEVKFDEEQLMYAYLNAAIKHALARNNVAPSIDFSLDPSIEHLPAVHLPVNATHIEKAQQGYLSQNFQQKNQAHFIDKKDALQNWKQLYEIAQQVPHSAETIVHQSAFQAAAPSTSLPIDTAFKASMLLIQGKYLLCNVKSGLMYVHIYRAHERIAYERLQNQWANGKNSIQQLLFPIQYELSNTDEMLLLEILPELEKIGIDLRHFGKNVFVLHGVPLGQEAIFEKDFLELFLEDFKNEASTAQNITQQKMLQSLAKNYAYKATSIHLPEMQQALIDELFSCQQPELSPTGKKVFGILSHTEIEKWLDD